MFFGARVGCSVQYESGEKGTGGNLSLWYFKGKEAMMSELWLEKKIDFCTFGLLKHPWIYDHSLFWRSNIFVK